MNIKLIKKVCGRIYNFLNPAVASKQVYDEIKDQRARIKLLMEDLRKSNNWNERYVSTLASVTSAMEAMVWEKDENHLYLLANALHCRSFFNIEGTESCLDYILGKSDLFLIDLVYRKEGIQNTFGEICLLSDKYTQERGTITHFLEAGKVDGEEVLLYIIKIPQFNENNVFTGTVGLGWNFSKFSCILMPTLNRWIYDKDVDTLHCEKDVFCYALSKMDGKTCGIFNHLCPKPMREDHPSCTCDRKESVKNDRLE